jgi:hypothetical protein
MNVDEMESEEFPMSPEMIACEQKKDTYLREVMKKSDKFSERLLERSTVITYDIIIYIPISLRMRIVWWYHTYLQHPGIARMEATLRQNLTWADLKRDVEAAVKNCHGCQIGKKVRNKYGDLPEKQIPIAWNRVDVDLVTPLTIKTSIGMKECLALTMIDPSTGWFEVKDVKDKPAKESMNTVDDISLSRYPRPEYTGFENGGEYKNVFEELVKNYGIKKRVVLHSILKHME